LVFVLIFLDTYLIAREKAKKAENTSDICTHESSQEMHSNSSIKQFKKSKINYGKKKQDIIIWSSPCSELHCKLFYNSINVIHFNLKKDFNSYIFKTDYLIKIFNIICFVVDGDDSDTDPNYHPREEQRPSGNIYYDYDFNCWYNLFILKFKILIIVFLDIIYYRDTVFFK